MGLPEEVRDWASSTGRSKSQGLPGPELVAEYDALVELGLVERPRREVEPGGCDYWMVEPERYCKHSAIAQTGRCVYHGGTQIYASLTAQQQRDTMLQVLLPQAMQRLAGVLHDPEAKDEIVVRAVFGVMDRVGLGPVQGLILDANVNHRLPREQLSEMLGAIADRLGGGDVAEIVDAEVVESAAIEVSTGTEEVPPSSSL